MSKSPSVIGRVTGILNLFDADRPLVSIDDIAEALGISAASAYRYTSELSEAGLLSRTSGHYRLGPKIIELEYLIQSYDPVLRAGRQLMEGLSAYTQCNVLLCNVYDQNIVNVLHLTGKRPVPFTYTKGMRMPLFRGAQAHIVLAHMDRRRLRRVYDNAIADPAVADDVRQIGEGWQEFSKQLREIRRDGYYVSRNQLDLEVTGIAAPVFGESQEIVGSLVLIHTAADSPALTEEAMVQLVTQTASEISRRLGSVAAP